MAAERRATLRQRLFAILVAGIGGAVASAVTFAITVYQAANPDPVQILEAGEPVDTGRWIVAVQAAHIVPPPPSNTEPFEQITFLTVTMDVENRSAATSHVSANLLALDQPAPQLPTPDIYLARDESQAGGLNPGMPERVVAAWEWPQSQPVPDELRLVIGSQTYKRRDNLYGASGWFEGEPVALVALPVSEDTAEER